MPTYFLTTSLVISTVLVAGGASAADVVQSTKCSKIRVLEPGAFANDGLEKQLATPELAGLNYTKRDYNHFAEFEKAGGKGRPLLTIRPAIEFNPPTSNLLLQVDNFPERSDPYAESVWLKDSAALSLLTRLAVKHPVFLFGNVKWAKAFVAPAGHPVLDDLVTCGILKPGTKSALFLTGEVQEDSIVHEQVHLEDIDGGKILPLINATSALQAAGKISFSDSVAIQQYVKEQRAYARQIDYVGRLGRTAPGDTVYAINNGSAVPTTRRAYARDVRDAVLRNFELTYAIPTAAALSKLNVASPTDYETIRKIMNELCESGPMHPDEQAAFRDAGLR